MPNSRRLFPMVLGIATLLVAGSARAVPITFQVRMAFQIELGAFDPVGEFVDLAGSFNGWGTAPLTPLFDADGDSIWAVTLDGFTPGETIEYKFRYNGVWDGREEFPGVGFNRSYTVQPDGNEILVWFADQDPGAGHDGSGELHWWNDAVFYEVFVRSFQDSDGDGIGDLRGLTQRLDYLNDGDPNTHDDLGVTALWLMPVNDSPSYHGYDAVDYRTIEPDYGTLQDFRDFLDAAHTRGIRVIVDYVMNHCSDQHPWFTAAAAGDPAFRDYFRWSPADPGQNGPWGQQVWHWNPSGWYYGLFSGGMPDLNYDTPAVKDTMFETATWWLQDVGVDGFRLDAVLYIDEDGDQLQNTPGTLQFWHDFEAHTEAVQNESLTVGEAWTTTATVLNYVNDDRLDLCFEFDLAGAILGAVNGADVGWLHTKAAQVYALYPFLQTATFLTNHDQDRLFEVLGRDEGRNRAAAGLLLTLPGVPFLYYGEEIGLDGSGDHLNIRRPMQWTDGPDAGFTGGTPWQPVDSDYAQTNVATEDADPASLLSWYRRLIHLRQDTPALRRGTLQMLDVSTTTVLAFLRSTPNQTVLSVTNTSPDASIGHLISGVAGVLPAGTTRLVNLMDPADVRDVAVSESGEIAGLDLAGYETAVFAPTSVTDVQDGDGALPQRSSRLDGIEPNPFNPATTIRYTLTAATHVRLGVFDTKGRLVAQLQDGPQPAGAHTVRWNGRTRRNEPAGAGVYLVRLEAGGDVDTAKAVVLK